MAFLDRFSERVNKIDTNFINLVKALDNGEEWAARKFDEMWESNDPTLFPRMDKARIEIYSDAARMGDPKAQYWLGLSLRRTDMQESLKWLMPLANHGNIDAMIGIALGYTEFGGFGDNPEQYRYWYMQAAKAGDPEAQATIGLEYTIEQKYDEALKWHKQAAQQRNSKGAAGVAKCYESLRDRLPIDYYFQNAEEQKRLEQEYNNIIENAYIDAANWAQNVDQQSTAFSGLGHFYYRELLSKPDSDCAKRAAYFLYVAYLSGNEYELKWFEEVVSKFNLYVNTADIEGWAAKEGLFS